MGAGTRGLCLPHSTTSGSLQSPRTGSSDLLPPEGQERPREPQPDSGAAQLVPSSLLCEGCRQHPQGPLVEGEGGAQQGPQGRVLESTQRAGAWRIIWRKSCQRDRSNIALGERVSLRKAGGQSQMSLAAALKNNRNTHECACILRLVENNRNTHV